MNLKEAAFERLLFDAQAVIQSGTTREKLVMLLALKKSTDELRGELLPQLALHGETE